MNDRATWADHVRTSLSDLAPGEARLMDWAPREYHDDEACTSRSQLEVLRRDGPQTFASRFVDRTMADKPSKEKRLGTLLHLRVLEPERWSERVAPPKPYIGAAPERPAIANGKAKKGSPEKTAFNEWKAATDEWDADNAAAVAEWQARLPPDAITLTHGETLALDGMTRGLESHPKARELLWEAADGVNEQAIVWRHPATGVLIRVLVDRMVPYELPNGRTLWMVPDLKTTIDPITDGFRRSVVKYGYHRQGAVYHDAVQALHPTDLVSVVFIAVRNAPDWDVACHDLGPDELACGRRQYENTLRELIVRRESNNWRHSCQDGINRLTLPEYEYDKP